MESETPTRAEIFDALLPWERHRLTVVLILGSLMYPLFTILDLISYAEKLRELALIRAMVTTALLLGLVGVRRARSMTMMYVITSVLFCFTSWGISLMVWLTDGATSPYYAGLALVMVLVCVVFTWPLQLSLILHLLVFASYLMAVFLHREAPDLRALANNLFFLVSTMVVTVVGGVVRFRLTVNEAAARLQLERSHRQLEELSRIDPLTGLLNRRTLDEKIGELLSLSKRYAVPSSVLLIDLDKFKSVNDVLGHRAGDELLKRIARLLREGVRDTDFVYRIGGDEFLIVLQNQDVKAAGGLAERLQRLIKAQCSSPALANLGVGASIGSLGIVYRAGLLETPADVYEAVDADLYEQKERNRDTVGAPRSALRC